MNSCVECVFRKNSTGYINLRIKPLMKLTMKLGELIKGLGKERKNLKHNRKISQQFQTLKPNFVLDVL